MSTGSNGARRLQRLRRDLAFVRHVPPRQLALRLALTMRRRFGLVASTATASPDLVLARSLPQPIMPPRLDQVARTPAGYELRLLGRALPLDGRLPWFDRTGGRERQLRQMTLHYMEYLEAVDDPTFAAIVGDWLDEAGTPDKNAWQDAWNSYALSLRVVVWLQQLAVRAGLDATLRDRMVAAIGRQLRFLERNLETDIGGNHLIKNIKALLLGSCALEGADTDRWRSLGLDLLAEAIERQILPDGMHYERSASYHAQVFVDLLECRSGLGLDPLHGRLDDTLARMAQVLADLAHPDGAPVQFSDSGLTMSYPPARCLAAYAAVLGRPAPAPRPLFALADAGYFGLRAGNDLMVADCGALAPDALPGHGHGDALAFEWSVDGQRIIVDQGVFEYVDGERRRLARAVASHNTVAVADLDQAEFYGDFRVGRRASVRLVSYHAETAGFRLEGSHDGFRQLGGGPIHVRAFTVSPDRIVLDDRLIGERRGEATAGLLLHPDVAVEVDGMRATIACGAVRIAVASDVPIAVEPARWWPDLGHEVATRRLVMRWPAATGMSMTTLTVVSRPSEATTAERQGMDAPGAPSDRHGG